MKFDNDFNEVKIRHVIAIYLMVIVILLGIIIFMSLNSDGEFINNNMNILSLSAGILLFIMLVYKVKPSKEKLNLLYKDFINKLKIKEITWIIIFFICLNIGGAKIIVDITYVISPSLANAFVNDNALTINSITDYGICFITLVILSPVIDELTFRYVLFKRLTKKFNVYAGLIVSSMIFSAINVCPEMIGTLALGIINCILYVKYENILMPMLIYVINNLFYMFISVPFGALKNKIINFTSNDIIINAIIGTVLLTIGIIFMVKFIIKNKVYLKENFIKTKVLM